MSQLVGWRGGWAGALRRIAAFPHAPAAGALLAVAAVTQAIALSASNDGISGSDREIVFVLVALFTTLPLGLLWANPAAAAVAVGAACVLSLPVFHALPVAGLIALLVLPYRLGRSGSQLLAAVLALPFVVPARPAPGPGSRLCFWPRSRRPRRGRGQPGGPQRGRRAQRRPGGHRRLAAGAHRAANAPASPASCMTSWPTTFP